MPRQPEVSRAALDRAHDLVGDVLVNIEAAGLHGRLSDGIGFRRRAVRADAGKRRPALILSRSARSHETPRLSEPVGKNGVQ